MLIVFGEAKVVRGALGPPPVRRSCSGRRVRARRSRHDCRRWGGSPGNGAGSCACAMSLQARAFLFPLLQIVFLFFLSRLFILILFICLPIHPSALSIHCDCSTYAPPYTPPQMSGIYLHTRRHTAREPRCPGYTCI